MLGIVKAEFVAWAKAYEGPRFHAVLCDPPYGLEFMGKEWDAPHKRTFSNGTRQETVVPQAGPEKYQAGKEYQIWTTEWAKALLPLLHPGALVFAFGGTRTWHRLACGFEDAGLEIWDTLMWLHGQGFPKAQAIDKLIDKQLGNERHSLGTRKGGAGNTESSAYVQAKRQMLGKGGTGMGYLEKGGLVEVTEPTEVSSPWSGHKTSALKPAWEAILCFRAPRQGKNYAELAMEYGSGALNVDGARVGYQSETDKSSATPQGECTNRSGRLAGKAQGGGERTKFERPEQKGRYPANLALDEESAEMLDEQTGRDKGQQAGVSGNQKSRTGESGIYGHYDAKSFPPPRDGLGGPSRFFYCAKASRGERGKDNNHPTVKPIALTKWLATLLLPPESVKPRRLLVPFAGSGSEMIGAIEAGWDEVVGVEQSEQYAEINSDLAVQRPLLEGVR